MSGQALQDEAQAAAEGLMRGHRVVLVLIREDGQEAMAALGNALSNGTVRRDMVKTLKAVIQQLEGN